VSHSLSVAYGPARGHRPRQRFAQDYLQILVPSPGSTLRMTDFCSRLAPPRPRLPARLAYAGRAGGPRRSGQVMGCDARQPPHGCRRAAHQAAAATRRLRSSTLRDRSTRLSMGVGRIRVVRPGGRSSRFGCDAAPAARAGTGCCTAGHPAETDNPQATHAPAGTAGALRFAVRGVAAPAIGRERGRSVAAVSTRRRGGRGRRCRRAIIGVVTTT